MKLSERAIWLISGIVSLVLIFFLFEPWIDNNQQENDPIQLPDEAAVLEYLKENWPVSEHQIMTGLFIQSLQFVGSTDVELSGYILQHYEDGIHDDVKAKPGEVGFVLPESVNAAGGGVQEA
ncbi:MAG: hypothetical protein ABJI96_02495 [Paracoccaceae bacterium]